MCKLFDLPSAMCKLFDRAERVKITRPTRRKPAPGAALPYPIGNDYGLPYIAVGFQSNGRSNGKAESPTAI